LCSYENNKVSSYRADLSSHLSWRMRRAGFLRHNSPYSHFLFNISLIRSQLRFTILSFVITQNRNKQSNESVNSTPLFVCSRDAALFTVHHGLKKVPLVSSGFWFGRRTLKGDEKRNCRRCKSSCLAVCSIPEFLFTTSMLNIRAISNSNSKLI